MSSNPEVKVGQIWREVDPLRLFDRHIQIEHILPGRAGIVSRTVLKYENLWVPAPRSRSSYGGKERFNGKRGGYELVEDVK